MTFTVSLSIKGVELIQCFTSGGTTHGTFEVYFEKLIKTLFKKYANKNFVIVLDNCWSHKSELIIKLLASY